MNKVLITGGAGFFGTILKEYLLKQGLYCVSIDIQPDNYNHANFRSIQGDIRDVSLIETIFKENKFDAIFHLAALLAHVKKDYDNIWSTNTDGTRIIAESAKKYSVQKLIFTSTNCLWGQGFDKQITEEDIPNPIEIYGKSKLEAERILKSYSKSFNSIIFRCPTIIDEGRLGLLGILFEFIDENRKIWMVGDGKNRYQFIYAKDLALACFLALNYNRGTEIFNIGSDNVKTFNEVYKYVIDNSKSKSRLVHLPKKPLEMLMKFCYRLGISPLGPYQYKMISSNFIFNTDKIKQELNFTPTLTNEQMLLKAYNYYHNNKNEIKQRKHVSAHKQIAQKGIIELVKFFS